MLASIVWKTKLQTAQHPPKTEKSLLVNQPFNINCLEFYENHDLIVVPEDQRDSLLKKVKVLKNVFKYTLKNQMHLLFPFLQIYNTFFSPPRVWVLVTVTSAKMFFL